MEPTRTSFTIVLPRLHPSFLTPVVSFFSPMHVVMGSTLKEIRRY
jgi:hypothetical protein